jgi:hypothetical protein
MQHYVSNFLAIMGPAATRDEIPLVPLLPQKKVGLLFLYFVLQGSFIPIRRLILIQL